MVLYLEKRYISWTCKKENIKDQNESTNFFIGDSIIQWV